MFVETENIQGNRLANKHFNKYLLGKCSSNHFEKSQRVWESRNWDIERKLPDRGEKTIAKRADCEHSTQKSEMIVLQQFVATYHTHRGTVTSTSLKRAACRRATACHQPPFSGEVLYWEGLVYLFWQ